MPAEISFFEPYVEAARSQLDDAGWDTAWQEGRAMSMEEAIEFALSDDEPAPPLDAAQASEGTRVTKQPATLTSREQDVAALVTQGLTNRQIASELSISEHTVATHIATVMKKLGFHSRAQITAWVTEQRMPPVDSD
jgi:DNA-binding NarL/FixJ family response regulator